MNHVLLWKEYRQQRAIWLAIALLGILLVLILGLALGQGSGLEAFRDGSIRPTLITIILALGVTYGIVCGALLLAGEKEDRTLNFLDGLAGQRGPVWGRKATAGALFTLAQALIMTLLLAALGLGSWRTGFVVFYWCLDGLAWGLLGGSLCQKVLTAVLAGIAFMGSTWLLSLFVESFTALYLGKTMLAGAGVLYSRKMFCLDDPSRQIAPRKSRFTKLFPASWRVLIWLSFRQGRWVLAGGLAFAVALGLTVNLAPLILWPIGTLLLGLTCGLATFCPDQGDGSRFLGAQRFSPHDIWLVKLFFWGTAAFLLTYLAWQVGLAFLFHQDLNASMDNWFRVWIGSWTLADEFIPRGMFLCLWSVYGFFFGLFFGQVAARPILAVILATATASVVTGLWAPSLFFGGVGFWQFVGIPLFLLFATQLGMWPWMSGRMSTGRPLLCIAGAVGVIILAVAGFLWYRAVEVPDVGEPFDVKAFVASLPSPEENEAGLLLRRSGTALREQKRKVNETIKPPTKPIFPEQNIPAPEKLSVRDYEDSLWKVTEQGWPKQDKEFGRWLDDIFHGEWVEQATRAANLPLGMVQDPRLTSFHSSDGQLQNNCTDLFYFFACRALQVQARGDSRQALKHLETALALARQVRHNSPEGLYLTGCRMESTALAAFDFWLQKTGPDKKLLREGLTILQRHESATPDPTGSIKAEYLVYLNSLPSIDQKKLVEELHRIAYQIPWEKERQDRIVRAVTFGQLQLAEKPVWQTPDWRELDHFSGMARSHGLPPADGPASGLSAKQWGQFLQQSWAERYSLAYIIPGMRKRSQLRALQLVTAVALFQAEQGKPPRTLDDLVPKYLPKLPIDPSNGKSFRYRISTGEEIKRSIDPNDNVKLRLVPGQALVWSEGPRECKYPVPVWKKGAGP